MAKTRLFGILSQYLSFLPNDSELKIYIFLNIKMEVPTLHVVASILAWMSAVINPFIYAFKNRQYKQAFKKVTFKDTSIPFLSYNGQYY